MKTKTLPRRLVGFSGTAPEGLEYLAMVDTGWARDPDLLTAVSNACEHGRGTTPAKGPLVIFIVSPGTRISEMGGTICQRGDIEPIQIYLDAQRGREEHSMRLSKSMIDYQIRERILVE